VNAAVEPPSDDHVAAVALAGLEALGARRIRVLVERFGSPARALHALVHGRARSALLPTFSAARAGELDALTARWRRELDPAATHALLVERGAHVWIDGESTFPIADPLPDRPTCLVAEGDRVEALDAPRVAIVGTRSATPHGIADAQELAATLADAGITVVSGLAIGIDGAAHAGAIRGGGLTVGVVATGLDVEYPRRHRGLYRDVRAHGIVLGETGYGIGPTPMRFPVRNRVIAALADVVVVVEATISGGARITAEHAMRYDRAVFAVPGSRRNTAAAGTNALIADGAYPLTEWSDVVVALGMTPGARRPAPARAAPDASGRSVIDALAGEPASPEDLASRTGLAPAPLAATVARLERDGWVTWEHGLVWPR
jgi:DNA processing protein